MPTTYPTFSEILRVPGLLYWNPSALTSEATYGTLLGYTEDGVHFDPGLKFAQFQEEEYGEELRKVLFLGASPVVMATLQNYNTTALSRLFPGMVTGTATKIPGSYLAGKDLSTTSAVYGQLLFMPEDETNNPCVILQRAVPHVLETARLNFSHVNRTFFSVVFEAIRKTDDVDGEVYVGLKSGAVLR